MEKIDFMENVHKYFVGRLFGAPFYKLMLNIWLVWLVLLSARGTRALIHLAFCHHYCHHCHVAPFPQIRHFIISSVILVSESAS